MFIGAALGRQNAGGGTPAIPAICARYSPSEIGGPHVETDPIIPQTGSYLRGSMFSRMSSCQSRVQSACDHSLVCGERIAIK